MALVQIQRDWPDGDTVTVTVKVGHSYPDELDEAKRAALDAFTEACGVVLAPEAET